PTPVAKAKADAEWPEGKEKLPGRLIGSGRSPRRLGGRPRRARYFNGRFTSVDVMPIDITPRSAARCPRRPPTVAIRPAITIQSNDRFAALLNRLRLTSTARR